jgi:hypothetical protein
MTRRRTNAWGNGIADLGFALMSWFIDPAKNCLGLAQMK